MTKKKVSKLLSTGHKIDSGMSTNISHWLVGGRQIFVQFKSNNIWGNGLVEDNENCIQMEVKCKTF